jgi:membrane-bound serine protease (ClpP class)
VIVTLVSAALVLAIAGMAAKARRRPVVSGTRRMIGAFGEVIAFAGAEGWAAVDGERWRVRAAQPLHAGQRVRITRIDGLTLDVSPITQVTNSEGGPQ